MSVSIRASSGAHTRTQGMCATGLSSSVEPQPRISTFPACAAANTSSAVKSASSSPGAHRRSSSDALPSRNRCTKLFFTRARPATRSARSLLITLTPSALATPAATSSPRTPSSIVIATTGISGGLCLVQGGLDQRPKEQHQCERRHATDERLREEDRHVALRDEHRLPKGALGAVTEHEREHERRERIVELAQHVPRDAEDQHQVHVEHRVVHGVRADRADHYDDRRNDRERYPQDRGE